MRHQIYRKYWPGFIPTRVLVCVMMFTACWTTYMCRLQMPILVLPMMGVTKAAHDTKGACPREESAVRRRRDIFFDPEHHFASLMYNEPQDIHVILPRSTNSSEDLKDSERNLTQGSLEHEPFNLTDIHGRSLEGFSFFGDRTFDWNADQRAQLIASYSYGNMPGNLIGGVMTVKFGPRRAILWSSLVAAVLSLLSPVLVQVHWTLLLVSRIIIGVTGGITFPACHAMVAQWAPPTEKSKFIWSLLGGTFGTIFTYPMIASIASNLGWMAGWYIASLLMLVWIVFWALIVFDSPKEHPGISDEERDYILREQGNVIRTEKPSLSETPILKIMTSIPFLSLLLCHFGNIFLLFFYQNSMMIFLTEGLGLALGKGGFWASLPWAARMLFGFFFSWAGDTIKKKELLSITWLRKTATIFSHLIPGLCLGLVGYLGCNKYLVNFFLALALGFNGAASISNLSNNQDLSPNFAGFLYGIINAVGCSSGMIIPPIVEAIAGGENSTLENWRTVFWIGSSVCILSMLIFVLGGSGDVQSWNELSDKTKKKAEAPESAEGASNNIAPANGAAAPVKVEKV